MMTMSNVAIYTNENGISLKELIPEDHDAFYELLCEESDLIQCDDLQKQFYGKLFNHMMFYVLSSEGVGRLIGYVCFTHHEHDQPEIGIYISPEYRRKGIASEFIPKAMAYYTQTHTASYFIYRVKSYNNPSQELAKSLGAVIIENEGDLLYERLLALSEKFTPDIREDFINEFVKGYNPERDSVIKYRLDIKV